MREFVDLSTLPKAEARILIAKDVLKQLDLSSIEAVSGSYLRFFPKEKIPVETPLHEVLKKNKCQTCALGALLYSRVQIANKLDCEELNTYGLTKQFDFAYTTKQLLIYFEQDQLTLIEHYFEGWYSGYRFWVSNPNPKLRMRKIMQNIIDNQGTFKPETL